MLRQYATEPRRPMPLGVVALSSIGRAFDQQLWTTPPSRWDGKRRRR